MQLTHPDPQPARFQLHRHRNLANPDAIGLVASGCQWPDGVVALRWNTSTPSVAIYDSITVVQAVHGHNGDTEVLWLDTPYPVGGWTANPEGPVIADDEDGDQHVHVPTPGGPSTPYEDARTNELIQARRRAAEWRGERQ